jgi:hypothetical protein
MNPNVEEPTYVRKNEITSQDFIVGRGGANQHRKAHKNLYDDRDNVCISDNYPSLGHAGKLSCRIKVYRTFIASGGRFLQRVEGNNDLYFVVPEQRALQLIAQKFRQPRPHARAALLAQRLQQQPEQVAPVAAVTEEIHVVPSVNENNSMARPSGSVDDLHFIATQKENEVDSDIRVAADTFDHGTHLENYDDFDFNEYLFIDGTFEI